MKKILTIAVMTIVFAANGFAQDYTLGVRVGMNVANILGDFSDADYSAKLGLKAGIVGCFNLDGDFYLEPGIYFAPKGAKKEYKDIAGNNIKDIYNLNYLEIPVNAVYKYEINSNLTVRGFAGPYFGFGMFGRHKYEVNGSAKDKDGGKKQKAFSSKATECNFQQFDFGMNIGGGLEFSVCYLGIQYGMGFLNFNSKNDKDYKMRNGVFAVEFGVNF